MYPKPTGHQTHNTLQHQCVSISSPSSLRSREPANPSERYLSLDPEALFNHLEPNTTPLFVHATMPSPQRTHSLPLKTRRPCLSRSQALLHTTKGATGEWPHARREDCQREVADIEISAYRAAQQHLSAALKLSSHRSIQPIAHVSPPQRSHALSSLLTYTHFTHCRAIHTHSHLSAHPVSLTTNRSHSPNLSS